MLTLQHMEKNELSLSRGGGEKVRSQDSLREELVNLISQYGCGAEEGPQWSVWGRDGEGNVVLHWIRPCEEDRLTAQRVARLITDLGGSAKVERSKTEKLQ
jgi:hypothetical protein